MIQAIDLFCGVGGLTHGLANAGVLVSAGVDVDPHCRSAFEANNEAEFIQSDVADLDGSYIRSLMDPDAQTLLAGCAPCQPFSTYSRPGRDSRRSQDWALLRHFGRLISDVSPDYVTMENVPQLASHSIFTEFLSHLDGYHVAWQVVQCSEYGIPQSRTRLVLLASRHGSLTFPDPEGFGTETVRSTIAGLAPLEAGGQDQDDPVHRAPKLSPLNQKRIRASKPGGSWRDWPEELRATCHTKESGQTYPSVYGRMEWDKPSPTMTTQCFGYGNGRFGHPEQHRAISLREAAMLQTFPEHYQFAADPAEVRFNRLGRLIGNAVPVRLAEIVGRVLVDHDRDLSLR